MHFPLLMCLESASLTNEVVLKPFLLFLTILFYGRHQSEDEIKGKVNSRQVFFDLRYCTNKIGIIVCVTKFL